MVTRFLDNTFPYVTNILLHRFPSTATSFFIALPWSHLSLSCDQNRHLFYKKYVYLSIGPTSPQHSPMAHPEPHYVIPLLLHCDGLTLKIVEYFHYILYFSSHIFLFLLQIFHKVGTDVFWCYESRKLYFFSHLLVYMLNDSCNSLCFILHLFHLFHMVFLLSVWHCYFMLQFPHLRFLSHFLG